MILFGYPSSGKTFFGTRLARELDVPFIDTDRVIEELYREETGQVKCCRQIVMEFGEEKFREMETRVIEGLEKREAVIAVGGGAVLSAVNCERLKRVGELVYLEVEKEMVRKRVLSGGTPAFLDPADREGSFEAMYEVRKGVYEAVRSVRVRVCGKSDERVVEELRFLWDKGFNCLVDG